MKLITLNIWGGHISDPLLEFINSHRDVDIFCLQEVYNNAKQKLSTDGKKVILDIFEQLQALLPEHRGFFRPVVNDTYGIAMFVKNSIEVSEESEICIHPNPDYPGFGPTHPRNLQWIKCQIDGQPHYIMNVHGLWNGKGKKDCPERIAQSQRICEFIDRLDAPQILCGDFNLRPDTESLQMIAKGLKDLIQLHKVESTRTSLYDKEEKFADYIFTSHKIPINRFEVLADVVSDHAPLFLDFGCPLTSSR